MVGVTALAEVSVVIVVDPVGNTGAGTTEIVVVEPTQVLVPQAKVAAQQPPPSDAGQRLKPAEQAVAAGRVVVVVLVVTLTPETLASYERQSE
jgi:hypothetical protein